MSTSTSPYDDDNVFAKILRGEIPAVKVYEDEVALAFMDVMPQADGHVLVIPKAKARGLLDVAPDVLSALMTRVQTVARAVKTALDAEGITLLQYNEAAGGQTVFHLHFHVVPRHHGVTLRPHTGKMADMEVLKTQAAKIAKALESWPPPA
jgi:histidine triad (HIT) family protein